jgi:hypothetical protein
MGRKGQAKRAVRDRLNAMAASERQTERRLAVAQRRQFKKDAMATIKAKERQARASPAESTQCAHHVDAQHSSASVEQEHRALPRKAIVKYLNQTCTCFGQNLLCLLLSALAFVCTK